MKSFQYVITDPEGIHARPAGNLVKEAKKFESTITLGFGKKTADAKKIFAVMGLSAKQGAALEISVEGHDEEAAVAAMEKFFHENL